MPKESEKQKALLDASTGVIQGLMTKLGKGGADAPKIQTLIKKEMEKNKQITIKYKAALDAEAKAITDALKNMGIT